ncbi:TPA: hypothetical protein DEP94_02790 [Candidatus Nomurabacteria bacterium]|nr:hypothetical protein [Candidatus Nomurabacteria bacterium]
MDIENKHLCTLCDSLADMTFRGMEGYVKGTKFNVYECKNCQSSFVDPMSNLKEQYDIIYGGDTTKDAGYNYYYYLANGVKKLSNPLKDLSNYSAIFWGVIKAIKDRKINNGAKMLEVGSGLGYLTYAFNKAGYDCEGLDYSDTATDFANNFYGKKFFQGTVEDFSLNHLSVYDVIVATEVIEHVVDPNLFVKNIMNMLKPGGTLIITTPIKDIHPTGTIWETNPAPEHLWWFTEKGIKEVGMKNNAVVSFIDFTEYTKNKVWSVNLGTANTAPNKGQVVDKDGHLINLRKKGYKEKVMSIIPAWLYMKLVIFYHNLRFLQKNKTPTRYMYGMCAVFIKN